MEALFGRGRLGLTEKRENVSGFFSFLKMKTMRSINYIYETVNLEQDAKTACLGARYHHRALENIVNMRKIDFNTHPLIFHWHLRALLWELKAALDTIKRDKKLSGEKRDKKLSGKEAPWINENWYEELLVLRDRSHQCFNFVTILRVGERIAATKLIFPVEESGKSKSIMDIPKKCKGYIVRVEEVLNKLYKK